MKIFSLVILFIFFALPEFGFTGNRVFNDWIFDPEKNSQQVSIKSYSWPKDKSELLLTVYCHESVGKENGFYIYLLQREDFKTKGFGYANITVTVDQNPPLSLTARASQVTLGIVQNKSVIKELLAGKSTYIEFEDINGHHNLEYSLVGFSDAIKMMEKECGYKFTGERL